jgi:hypothetical protein
MVIIVWLIVVGALIAIVQLILPLIPLGSYGNLVVAIMKILIGAAILIGIVVIVFDVLSCLLGSGLSLRR